MLLPMLLACGDKEEEADSAAPDTEEVVEEEEQSKTPLQNLKNNKQRSIIMGEVLKMKAGKIDLDAMRKGINKRTGLNVAHNLSEGSPTIVKEWIPTGSRWLDSITCRGKKAGIPVGKITEIAGLSASGKSFMAALISANAQKNGSHCCVL